jgi:hypothetical protein
MHRSCLQLWSRIRTCTGELHEADKVALAIRAAKPNVV